MNSRTKRTYYMHTLNGRPAVFCEGQGVCFASFYGKPNRLARSLKQIRAEQAASRHLDDIRGGEEKWAYGYIRVTP